jgi:uncharacterized protein YjcR
MTPFDDTTAWVPYPHIFSLIGLQKTYERGRVMPTPKGNKFAVGNKGGGRFSQLDPNFIRRAELACRAGFTGRELAELFDVSLSAIQKWKRHIGEIRIVNENNKKTSGRTSE